MSSSPEQFFAPRRLGHVNLWTGDLAEGQKFYNEICGLAVEFTEPGLAASFLGTGNTPHDVGLIQKTDGLPRYGRDGHMVLPPGIGYSAGLNHIAWELENEADLVRAFRQLQSRDVQVDMTVDHQIAHSVYLRDPDGNSVEFYCDTVQNWRTVLHGDMDLITSFWDPLTAQGFTEGRYEEHPPTRAESSAPIHPWRLTHVVLETASIDAMENFYTKIGGLKGAGNALDGDVRLFGGSHTSYPFNLALCAADAPQFSHAAFELRTEQELERSRRRLLELNVSIAADVDTPWKRAIFLRDSDGLALEFYVRRPGVRQLREVSGVHFAWLV
jgi:catechol 2,3-dioxygenase